MKYRLQRRFLTAGAALCLSFLASAPAFAAELSGHLDSVNESQITGWAWDKEKPSSPVSVELTLSGAGGPGGAFTVSVTADQSRSDLKKALGSSAHGFTYAVDWDVHEGDVFTVSAEIVSGDTRTPLEEVLTYTKSENRAEAASGGSDSKEKTAAGEETSVKKPSESSEEALGPGADSGENSASGTSSSESGKKTEAGQRKGPSADSNPPAETGAQGNYLGEFVASGYCNCSRCSGGHNLTYSGTVPKAKHTIAADTSVFPIGTKIMIDGVIYTVEDIGSGVYDNRLDIFFESHQEALDYGLKRVKVYSVQ